MRKPIFREDKTTEAAAILLEKAGGCMNYMKLIKLLYLADRKALLQFGRPISYDSYFSMDRGPVLSRTFDLIKEVEPHRQITLFGQHISEKDDYDIRLKSKPLDLHLSDAEIKILYDIFKEFGDWSEWKLVEYVHTLPEWVDPHGSSIPFDYSDIFKAEKLPEAEIEAINEEMNALATMESILY